MNKVDKTETPTLRRAGFTTSMKIPDVVKKIPDVGQGFVPEPSTRK
jgi:hypothetical protein